MIWFGGCFHLFHANILKFYPSRGFSDCEAMWNNCIESIDNTVKVTDHIIFCGDWCYGSHHRTFVRGKWEEFRKAIKCKHWTWIRGNHDDYFKDSPEWKDYYEFKYEKNFFCCSHYPMISWRGSNRTSIQIHSHVHGNLQEQNKNVRRIDVGYDAIGKWLISAAEVIELKQNLNITL